MKIIENSNRNSKGIFDFVYLLLITSIVFTYFKLLFSETISSANYVCRQIRIINIDTEIDIKPHHQEKKIVIEKHNPSSD